MFIKAMAINTTAIIMILQKNTEYNNDASAAMKLGLW